MTPKNDVRFDVLGGLDEVSCYIGCFKHLVGDVASLDNLEDIQRNIYLASAVIANPSGKNATFSMDETAALEREVDNMTDSLPPLRDFILPGGEDGVALIHITRAVCRRVERQLSLIDTLPCISAFCNRLSDYLFTLARFVLYKRGGQDVVARIACKASDLEVSGPLATGPTPSSPPKEQQAPECLGAGSDSFENLFVGAGFSAASENNVDPSLCLVVKRDGTAVAFNETKIVEAIHKCYRAVSQPSSLPAEDGPIMQTIRAELEGCLRVHIEAIQDVVEQALMKAAPAEVAKAYILYRKQRNDARESHQGYLVDKIPDDVATPWGALGYVTFKRTYARDAPDGSGTESFRQTILRVLEACQTQLRVGFTIQELKEAYRYMISLKGLVSGRFLWQLGTQTVERLGMMSLQNCAFVRIDEPVRPFLWVFDALMLGTGVGCSVQRHHVCKLPAVKCGRGGGSVQVVRDDSKDADFIVPDKREGWVALLERVLTSFFVDGRSFSYSTMLIRSRGSPIKGFGGTASGPEDLCAGIANIVDILRSKEGQQLSSVDCLDIVCIIGSIVVAGNIRRSAILVMGDADDAEFMRAKRWDLGGIPNWRAMSNNSVVCADTSTLTEDFWAGYQGQGEPYGLINLELARACGRVVDGDTYPDPDAEGFNPCAEQSLCNYETCCLAEVFLPNIDSYEELKRVATVLYRICKHSLRLPCHHPETEAIVHANMRMGIGMTGLLQATDEQRSWLPSLYGYLRTYDVQYSASHGFPRSIKLTTVKPSGTLSLLAGVTPGVHPGIYKYFIRRIRISSKNPLVELCRQHGFHTELQVGFDGTADPNTTVVSFPCRYPEHTLLASQMTAVDQLSKVLHMQREYSDNAVSCTVYYRKEELPAIRAWLATHYRLSLKGCSFLLHSEHGFQQAPYEEISAEQHRELLAATTPIMEGAIAPEDDESSECAGGACPLK